MKLDKKAILSGLMAASLSLSLMACGGKPAQNDSANTDNTAAESTAETTVENGLVAYENRGVTLNVPGDYDKLLKIETPASGDLFVVSELASIEAAKAQNQDVEGAGWLFSISTEDEATLHQQQCYDMSGMEVFARDEQGSYYMFEHPTDVRLVREDYSVMGDDSSPDWQNWTALNEWAGMVRMNLLADNQGMLEAFTRTNNMLDMYLARAAYQEDAKYEVISLDNGPMSPDATISLKYAEQLMGGNDVSYEVVDTSRTPDGEYIVLSFPEDDVRFDFFKIDDGRNYVRTVWSGDNEELMLAHFADDNLTSTDIAQAWYDELVAAKGGVNSDLGYTADDLVGRWAEKIAGRGVITIAKAAEEGKYDVTVEWANSAFEQNIWEMKAVAGNGGELTYENGKWTVRTFESESKFTDDVKYENGTGRFYLNSAHEVMWEDNMEQVAQDSVFAGID